MNGKRKIVSSLLVMSLIFSVLFANMSTRVYAEKNQLGNQIQKAENVIYVSQTAMGNASGDTVQNATEFNKAMENARAGDTFVLLGKVVLQSEWKTPSCNITIRGQDKNSSELMMQSGNYNGGGKASILLQGNLTLDNLQLSVVKNSDSRYLSLFVIVANGHRLIFGENLYTPKDTSTYSGTIYGGGFHKDIKGDTYIESHADLLVTTIYGGGCGGNVDGNVHLDITNTASRIFGGGHTPYKSSNTANVTGNVTINIKNAQLTSTPIIHGGGYASEQDANIGGDVTINHINVKDGGKNIYGAGLASSKGNANVGGNVNIVVKKYNMANNNATIYGAGSGADENHTASVKGNVDITYTDGNFGKVYGAGKKYADVDGHTNIRVENVKGDVDLYGGGEGTFNHKIESKGNVDISILNTRVQLFTQGVNAKVHGLVKVKLLGGGANRNIDSVDSNLYNRMRQSSSDASKGIASPDFKAVVEVIKGTSTITTINDFENVHIKDGKLCEHVRNYNGSAENLNGPRELFNNVKNVTIEQGGSLDLLGDNYITGNFSSNGNLTTIVGAKLVVEGMVSSQKEASYTSSNAEESYQKSYPFLQTKTDITPIAKFISTDNRYFVSDRSEGLSDAIVREWYLNKNVAPTIDAKDVTLIQGEHFDPFEGVSATDKEDGDLTKDIEIVENSVDTSKVGKYVVVYSVTDSYGTNTQKQIQVTVNPPIATINEVPVIDAKDVILHKGDYFNPLDNVTATDKEDGDLTKDIEIVENSVDTSKVGTYKVVYSVKDNVGARVTCTINVKVNPQMAIINQVPVIDAKDVILHKGEYFNPLVNVTAKDKEDGELTKYIKVIKNTVDTSKVGTYEVVYQVNDSTGATVTRSIKVIVKQDNKIPTSDNQTPVELFSIMMMLSTIILLVTINKKKL